MLQITETAEKKIASLIEENDQPIAGLRVSARAKSPFKVDYRLAFMDAEQVASDDQRLAFNGFDVFLDADSVPLLETATIDYLDGLMGSGFKIDTPDKIPEALKGTIAEKVMTVIEDQVNPAVGGHGGSVTLMDVRDNVVYVELGGGCRGCGMARVTLKDGIERMIMEAIPEVKEVVDVTDHSQGDSPYYCKDAQ